MRIAQVAPLIEAVPPKLYGGTERVVSWLSEALVTQGHNVTLFASGDSVTSAKLVAGSRRGLRLSGIHDQTASHLVMLDEVRHREAEFDIIHLHIDLLPFPLFKDLFHKCLVTLHGRLDIPDFRPVYEAYPGMPLVSISDHQRASIPHLNWIRTVHHGLPSEVCPFEPNRGDYLAFLGRISPEKRPDRAIEIAKQAGVPLKIAAKIDKVDEKYFEQEIRPLLNDPLVDFVGEVDERQKSFFLGNARALLFPIDWPEPFGLVMIEAMSCGTPIIAWGNGSVSELIAHGESGFIVNSVEEAVTAVEAAAQLSRHKVRRYFESQYTADHMASAYVKAYESLLQTGRSSKLHLVASS